jgi:hypothetical protein
MKITCSCIFNYKMGLNHRCDYDLCLILLVWTKMKMKNALYHPQLVMCTIK